MSRYFPKPYKSFEGKTSVKVDLSNYATKVDIENTSQDISSFCTITKFSQYEN